MEQDNCCPVESALSVIGKKWSINIVRDMFLGSKRFKNFLEANPDLSTKMLSARLKELEKNKIIEKNVVSKNPIIVEYHLTPKGRALNKILYEIAMFSITQGKKTPTEKDKAIAELKTTLNIA